MAPSVNPAQYKDDRYSYQAKYGNDSAPISAIKGIGSSRNMILAALAMASSSLEYVTPKTGYHSSLAENQRAYTDYPITYDPVKIKLLHADQSPSNGPKPAQSAAPKSSSYQQSINPRMTGLDKVYNQMSEQISILRALHAVSNSPQIYERKPEDRQAAPRIANPRPNVVYLNDSFRQKKLTPNREPGKVAYLNDVVGNANEVSSGYNPDKMAKDSSITPRLADIAEYRKKAANRQIINSNSGTIDDLVLAA